MTKINLNKKDLVSIAVGQSEEHQRHLRHTWLR